MSLRQLVLWRHGRTAWNAYGRIQGQTDVPLDDVGRAQARDAATRLASLSPTFILSSDLSRAADTATALAELVGLSVARDPRLREMAFGIREGLTHEQAFERHPEAMASLVADPSIVLEGAESYAEVGKRVAASIADACVRLQPGETGVLVGHGAALRVGICAFLELPEQIWSRFGGFSNCSWAVLEDRRRGWCITEWNAGSLPEPVLSDDERDNA
ncbi:MAG: histidine phosphatase family protein [Actinomycetota bacterium]|nr:histidine phosphatase family protein [Actinomycetota bacterium]